MNGGFDTEALMGKEIEAVVSINERGYPEVKSVRAMQ